jgi:MFS family permease
VLIASLSGAKPEEAGLASGLVNTSYQIGSALGLAAVTAIATSAAGASVSLQGLNDGYHAAFITAAAIAGVGALVALTLIRRPRAPVAVDAVPDTSPLEQAA